MFFFPEASSLPLLSSQPLVLLTCLSSALLPATMLFKPSEVRFSLLDWGKSGWLMGILMSQLLVAMNVYVYNIWFMDWQLYLREKCQFDQPLKGGGLLRTRQPIKRLMFTETIPFRCTENRYSFPFLYTLFAISPLSPFLSNSPLDRLPLAKLWSQG